MQRYAQLDERLKLRGLPPPPSKGFHPAQSLRRPTLPTYVLPAAELSERV